MLDQLKAALTDLGAIDASTLDDDALHDAVVAFEAVAGGCESIRSGFLAEWAFRGRWCSDGSLTARARLAHDTRCDARTAGRLLTRATKLRRMPEVMEAWRTGQITTDHVNVLCRANTSKVRHLFERDQAQLLDAARNRSLSFAQFDRLVRAWSAMAEDQVDPRDRLNRDRHLHASTTFGGATAIGGMLDPNSGAIFRQELERLEREMFLADWADAESQRGPGNVTADLLARTASQRRADALVEMAKRSRTLASTPTTDLVRPVISVLVGADAFKEACEIFNDTVLTPRQVAPLIADADIERVVYGPEPHHLELGRRARFYSPAQRRAIQLRDRVCAHPTCDIPAQNCDIDHIQEHSQGGPTTLANARLLCPRHNRQRPGRTTPPTNAP